MDKSNNSIRGKIKSVFDKTVFVSLSILISSSLFLSSCAPEQSETFGDKPNIVYILADDLGYGDLSLNGQDEFSTPNIDKLAKEGMVFLNHYSGSTVCAPSRYSLMTGLHTGHAEIRGNQEIQPEGQAPMDPTTKTIPTLLKKAGYVSGMFGKWGLGGPGSASDPMVYFDEFYGYNCQRYAHRYYPAYLWHNDKKVELEGNDWTNTKTFAPDLIQENALAFIEKNNSKKTGKPFFLYYSTPIPHAELIVPQDEILQKFQGKFDEKPYPGGNTEDLSRASYGPNMDIPAYCPQEEPKAAFAAMVTILDNQVGEIIEKLKELGIDNNTIVIFTSDNGAHAEGGIVPEDFDSNGKWRGMKRDLYEGGIHVPMLVRWPGKVEPEVTSEHISAFWDILPTFCDMAQVEAPDNIDGISFLPELLGKEQKKHDHLYWEFNVQGGKQAVRKGNWKAVRLEIFDPSKAKIELYDLEKDPGEKFDVSQENPDIIANMKAIMDKEHVHNPVFPL